MYTVYMHKFPNGKVYVGITKNSIYTRWANGQGYKHNKRMTNAIKRYGWENISHIIIAENISKEQACKLEIEKIKEFDSTNEQKGYNYSTGGESGASGVKQSQETIRKRIQNTNGGINPFLGKKHTEETKDKISAAGKGRKVSEETKRKISNSTKGVPKSETARKNIIAAQNWKNNIGKKLSDEQRKKMSEARKGIRPPNHVLEAAIKSRLKKVLCVETKEVFSSVKDASQKMGITSSCISRVCNGKRKKTCGYTFVFIKDGDIYDTL